MIWTDDGLVFWYIYVPLGHNKLLMPLQFHRDYVPHFIEGLLRIHFHIVAFCLAHWGWVKKMVVVLQTTYSNAFSSMEILVFWLIFFWRWHLRVLLIISITNVSEILIEIHTFSFRKMHLKLSSVKWQPFLLSLNVLIQSTPFTQ